MADVELEPKKKTEKLEWPRVVLASGFLLVIAALGIGAGSEGGVLAKYVALGGLGFAVVLITYVGTSFLEGSIHSF